MPFTFVPTAFLASSSSSPRCSGSRGFFMETYKCSAFAAAGIDVRLRPGESLEVCRGTLRGPASAAPAGAQAKLVRVLQGEILDVAADIRRVPHLRPMGQRSLSARTADQY